MVCIILVFYPADDLIKNILLTIKPPNIILLSSLHCTIFWIHDDIHAAVQHNVQVVSQNIFLTSEILKKSPMFAVAKIVSGGDMLVHSAEAVREAYTDTDQIKSDLREAINRGENPIIDISASFDGTCRKRGFTSLYGVSISTDVLTGYIVDYVVLSKYCHACKIQEESA